MLLLGNIILQDRMGVVLNKKYLRFLAGILIIISVIAISIYNKSKQNVELEESKKMEIQAIVIGNTFATYEKFDRELDINYFYNLGCNTTYSKIEKEIGKPNGGMGSGLVRPYYEVGSQYVVMSFSLNDKGEYDKLSEMSLYTAEEYIGDIPMKP